MIVFLLLTLKSISQGSSESDSVTCIPNSQLRSAIKKIENAKVTEQENSKLITANNTLLQRIETKDKRIAKYEQDEKRYLFVQAQDSIIVSNQRQIIVAKDGQILTYKRKWKAAKGWGWVKMGVGTAVAVLVTGFVF